MLTPISTQCTAARDFTRTTAPRVELDKAGVSLSQFLSAPSCTAPGQARRSSSRRDVNSKYGLDEPRPKTRNRLSLTSKQEVRRSRDDAGLQSGKISGSDKSRTALRKDQIREQGGTAYDSPLEARAGGRRTSNVCLDNERLPGVERELQSGMHVLAHKVTRQHLEWKAAADWTQSDVCDDNPKQFLREWIAPLLRSVAKKATLENDTVADDLTSSEKQMREKKVSRRRSSILSRYVVKRATE